MSCGAPHRCGSSFAGIKKVVRTARALIIIFIIAGMLGLVFWYGGNSGSKSWGLLSLAIVSFAVLFFYLRFERCSVSTREVAVITVLAALAATGRALSGPILSLQPTTFLVVITGVVFGPRVGFMVGASTPFLSNFFMGQGPWTPWQMLAWGLIGATAGWLKCLRPQITIGELLVFCILWGYLYGWLMNLWFWLMFFAPLTWNNFLSVYAASFGFDTCRAVGNGLFFWFIGPGVLKILRRFQRKLYVLPVEVIEDQNLTLRA